MKKLIVTEKERMAILESHNKLRDVLMGHLFDSELVSEETITKRNINEAGPVNPTGKDLLIMAQQKCGALNKSEIGIFQNALGQNKDCLEVIATADRKNQAGDSTIVTGDRVYYYPDMTWESYYTDPTTQKLKIRGSGVWNCTALNVQGADQDVRIQALKDNGYTIYDDLSAENKQLLQTKPNLFNKVIIGSTELYLPLAAGEVVIGDTQKTYLDQYTGGIFGKDYVTAKQRSENPSRYGNWIKVTVPKGNVFPNDYIIYRNPSNEQVALTIQNRQQAIQQQQITERTCIDAIQTWYDGWRTDTSINEVQNVDKMDVQKCSTYYSRGIYNYNRNIRNVLQALGGISNGPNYPAVPQYGDDAKWRVPFKPRTTR